ncbi:MAG: hypothetical protein ACE5J2_02600 [Nitrososphaerales archaeon]
MEPFVLVAGSVAGAFTAIAIDKVSQVNAKLKHNNNVSVQSKQNFESLDLERRIVSEAIGRVYYYERKGRISSSEREKLIARYKQQFDALNVKINSITLADVKEVSKLQENLVVVLDQRMAQINAKLDDLSSKICGNVVVQAKSTVQRNERKEERPQVTQTVNVEQVEASDSKESDTNLDKIKKQIMQTLSRLEQAEVE